MKKAILLIMFLLSSAFVLSSCGGNNDSLDERDAPVETNGVIMKHFTFESSQDLDLILGTSYLADYNGAASTKDSAIIEGKLLSAFGEPAYSSENDENSFDYVIIAKADDGRSAVLSVYGTGGTIHVGSEENDEFTMVAADSLAEYVNAFEPADYSRTVYYLDFDLKIDITVSGGEARISQSQLSEEEASGRYYDHG